MFTMREHDFYEVGFKRLLSSPCLGAGLVWVVRFCHAESKQAIFPSKCRVSIASCSDLLSIVHWCPTTLSPCALDVLSVQSQTHVHTVLQSLAMNVWHSHMPAHEAAFWHKGPSSPLSLPPSSPARIGTLSLLFCSPCHSFSWALAPGLLTTAAADTQWQLRCRDPGARLNQKMTPWRFPILFLFCLKMLPKWTYFKSPSYFRNTEAPRCFWMFIIVAQANLKPNECA